MRGYAKVLPQFWIGHTGKQIKDLGIEAQLLALYLMTSPHATMIGIYYLPISFITHETGLSSKGACKALKALSDIGFCTYDKGLEYVWVHEMALYQIAKQLKPTDNRVIGINNSYQNLPNLNFLSLFFCKYENIFWLKDLREMKEPSHILLSQEQEQDQDQKQEQEKIIMSGKPDVSSASIDKNQLLKSQAIEVLNFLNEKTGRAFRPADSNIKLIIARLRSGVSVMDCRQIIAKKTREWRGNALMAEYLRPATLFNSIKFEQYLGELVEPSEEENDEYMP